jgi:LCP family protein required for cell wall assembly
MESKGEKKRLATWKRVIIISICILLALVILLFAAAGIYINYLMSRMDRIDSDVSRLNSSEVDQLLQSDPDLQPVDPSESLPDISDITFPTEPDPPVEIPKHVINVLLIGLDETVPNVRARSDSMILLTANTHAKTVTFTSFMRDSYVQIPGYSPNKLNHAYQYGGAPLLCETLKANFGVEIDGAIEINFTSFTTIIDMLGGVEISLTEAEARYMNHPSQWGLTKGVNRLTGEQALVYARLREIDSDYQRSERQRTVLMALVNAYKNQPPLEMLDLLDDIMPFLSTDMSTDEMWDYGSKVVWMMAGARYTSQRLPADGTFSQGNVQVRPGLKAWFQYNIDFQANREILRRIFEE